MDGVLRKIERQYLEVRECEKVKFNIIMNESNYDIEQYIIKMFQWNDKVYARSQKLQVIIQMFQARMNKAEAELRKHTLNF